MNINNVTLPTYSKKEEQFNIISHGIASLLGLLALILMLVKAVPSHDGFVIASVIIYGACLFIMFGISCVYHSLTKSNLKKMFRILDHTAIHIFIAGTYTPYTLIALRPINIWHMGVGTFAYIMFAVVWALNFVGIVVNLIDIQKYRRISFICSLTSGWFIGIALFILWEVITPAGVLLLLMGGILYTIGSIIYAIGKKEDKPNYHFIFHLFVLLGAICMFLSVYLFVL